VEEEKGHEELKSKAPTPESGLTKRVRMVVLVHASHDALNQSWCRVGEWRSYSAPRAKLCRATPQKSYCLLHFTIVPNLEASILLTNVVKGF
jgi:hypothetical protein